MPSPSSKGARARRPAAPGPPNEAPGKGGLALPKTDKGLLLLLAALFLLTRLPLIFYMPLVQDEALYAVMIEEQAAHPTIIPTFLGYPVSWKPSLFYWTYLLPSRLSPPLPLEAAYRLPSVLFGLASLYPAYFLLRNAGASRNISFLSNLLFIFSFLTVYPDSTLLLDSMAFFFILASLWLYSEERYGRWRFIAAGALAFVAFWVKLVVAFMVPLLAVAYFLSFRPKVLRDRLFQASLLAVPLALVLHYSLMDSVGLAREIYFSDVGGKFLTQAGLDVFLNQLSANFIILMASGSILWISVSIYGFAKGWRGSLFMAAWYALLVFPFLFAGLLTWYYLPVMPAVGYFASLTLATWKGKERFDAVLAVFLAMLLLIVTAAAAYTYANFFQGYFAQREAGEFLSGKENVLIIGKYYPGVMAYKSVPEMRSGSPLDYGWIAFPDNVSADEASVFLPDYHIDAAKAGSELGLPVVDGSFTSIFTKRAVFRKDTNITRFDYIALLGQNNLTLSGYVPVFNQSNITIYRVK